MKEIYSMIKLQKKLLHKSLALELEEIANLYKNKIIKNVFPWSMEKQKNM